ncbi:MAG: prepilin-type N-terminal cleavage/methylation domain-containing protein [Sedimentisphaerales bacterium]|nr:prepilin-type N-terminal cleavage/methylation domain-containing protein [Sedimentisphaerales bacterium]
MKKKGFTLIELLVVITIIALLVSILMPSLTKAKMQAYTTVCSGNQKSLIQAWMMYAGDNGDKLVQNYVAQETMKGGTGQLQKGAWVEPPQESNGTEPDYTIPPATRYRGRIGDLQGRANAMELRKKGIRAGLLYKYLKTEEVFHCPGDKREAKGTMRGNTEDFKVYRTYSIALGAGPYKSNSGTYPHKAHANGGSIKQPQDKYVFVEHSYDCLACNYPDRWLFNVSLVGDLNGDIQLWSAGTTTSHGMTTTFGFADGHVETKKWDTKSVRIWFGSDRTELPDCPDFVRGVDDNKMVLRNNEDAKWLYLHNPGR